MAITTDPKEFESQKSLILYSDAATNDEAIREMDGWAREHGFVRTHEYNLNSMLRNGRRIFQGFCYRLDEENLKQVEADLDQMRQRRNTMPVTAPAETLLEDGD